jgi:AraC-like DNA-binding protein
MPPHPWCIWIEGNLTLLTFTPQPSLMESVRYFWYCHRYVLPHFRSRVLPTACVQLIIGLRDAPLRVCNVYDRLRWQSYCCPLVCGPHSKAFFIDTKPLQSSIGINFKPGGVFPFFGIPVGKMHNLNVPLDTLWGSAAQELRDRLLEAGTPAACFRVVEQFLLSQAIPARELHPAVIHALRDFQAVPQDRTIAEVIKHIGLSPRWFNELFRSQVGLPPKLYCRLRRFRAALTLIGQQPQPDWAELACACGYFDQAHFIRDFRAFSGLSPTSYLADRTEHQNHVRHAD